MCPPPSRRFCLSTKFSILTSVQQWWKRERARNGRAETIHKLLRLGWEFCLESMPHRRRQRYGDIEFDWEHRVDTTSATVSWRTRLLGVLNSPYQPIPPDQFREMMAALPIDFTQFTFIDIGSGKGRALLLAAEYGFRRILGVELLSELHEIARENRGKFLKRGKRANMELLSMDATEFCFPTEPTVVFLFNPLPEAGLKMLMMNLESSLRKAPRPLYLIYANPLLEQVIAGCRSLGKLGGTQQYSIFGHG